MHTKRKNIYTTVGTSTLVYERMVGESYSIHYQTYQMIYTQLLVTCGSYLYSQTGTSRIGHFHV